MKILFFISQFFLFISISPGQNEDNIQAGRTITKEKDGYKVEITIINVPPITGFAKLIELIPKNYSAKEIKTSGAVFTVPGKQAKFVWISFPSEEIIKVSYYLNWIGKNDFNSSDNIEIYGEMSYLITNETIKIPVVTLKAEGYPEEIPAEKKNLKLVPVEGSKTK